MLAEPAISVELDPALEQLLEFFGFMHLFQSEEAVPPEESNAKEEEPLRVAVFEDSSEDESSSADGRRTAPDLWQPGATRVSSQRHEEEQEEEESEQEPEPAAPADGSELTELTADEHARVQLGARTIDHVIKALYGSLDQPGKWADVTRRVHNELDGKSCIIFLQTSQEENLSKSKELLGSISAQSVGFQDD